MLIKMPSFYISDKILSGRKKGEELRKEVCNILKNNSLNTLMSVDFQHVKFLDYTCADEFICKLISKLQIKEYGDKYIILENINTVVKENISVALKLRKLVAIGINSNSYVLYGKFSKEIQDVFNLVVKKKRITARNLIDFEIVEKINVASNRLNKLCELGIIRKVRDEIVKGGGRQYVYQPIIQGEIE